MIPFTGYMFFLLAYVQFKYFMNRCMHGRTHTSTVVLAIREADYTYYHQDVKTGKIGSVKCNSSLRGPDITHYVFSMVSRFVPCTEYATGVHYVHS